MAFQAGRAWGVGVSLSPAPPGVSHTLRGDKGGEERRGPQGGVGGGREGRAGTEERAGYRSQKAKLKSRERRRGDIVVGFTPD